MHTRLTHSVACLGSQGTLRTSLLCRSIHESLLSTPCLNTRRYSAPVVTFLFGQSVTLCEQRVPPSWVTLSSPVFSEAP